MVQIALPDTTNFTNWTVAGAATAHEAMDEGVAGDATEALQAARRRSHRRFFSSGRRIRSSSSTRFTGIWISRGSSIRDGG